MNKQIEEMANDLAAHCPDLVENCCGASSCVSCLTRFLYTAGYRKQEWISVDERLPEDDETVLVITSESEMEVCFYKTESKGIFRRLGGLVLIYNVTHWMPLPEAPKMKGGE